MKKTLLFLTFLTGVVFCTTAQINPDIDMYTDATDNITEVWKGNYIMRDSDTASVANMSGSASENSNYIQIEYSLTDWWGGGQITLNNWWYHDAREHTHLAFDIYNDADNALAPASLYLQLQDTVTYDDISTVDVEANGVTGVEVLVFDGVATSYTTVKIPLSDFVNAPDPVTGKPALNLGALKFANIRIQGGEEFSSGTFYFDNFRITDEGNVAVNNETFAQDIIISPNPSTGLSNISTDRNIESLTITDQMGRVIESNSTTQIDLSNEPDGVYFVRFSSEGQFATKKIVKK